MSIFNKPRSGELFTGAQKVLASASSGTKWEKFPVEKALEIAARNNQSYTSKVDYTGPNPVTRANAGQPVSKPFFAAPQTTATSEKAPRNVPSAEALRDLLFNPGSTAPANRSR